MMVVNILHAWTPEAVCDGSTQRQTDKTADHVQPSGPPHHHHGRFWPHHGHDLTANFWPPSQSTSATEAVPTKWSESNCRLWSSIWASEESRIGARGILCFSTVGRTEQFPSVEARTGHNSSLRPTPSCLRCLPRAWIYSVLAFSGTRPRPPLVNNRPSQDYFL